MKILLQIFVMFVFFIGTTKLYAEEYDRENENTNSITIKSEERPNNKLIGF